MTWGYYPINSFLKNFVFRIVGHPHPYGRLRAREVNNYISNYFSNQKKTVDIGSGEGLWCMELSKQGLDMYGMEFSIDAIKHAKIVFKASNLMQKFVQADAQLISFKKGTFDQAICLDVLEHLDNPSKALKEINNILKKNGKLIITVPNEHYLCNSIMPFDLSKHAREMGHLHKGFNHKQIARLLEKNGFKVLKCKYFCKTFSRILIETLYFLMGHKSIRNNRQKMYKKSYLAFLIFIPIYILMQLDFFIPEKVKGAFTITLAEKVN